MRVSTTGELRPRRRRVALLGAVGAVGVEEGASRIAAACSRGGRGVGEIEQEGGVVAARPRSGRACGRGGAGAGPRGLARPGRTRRLRRASGRGRGREPAGSMAAKASAAIFSESRMPVSLSNMLTATTGATAPLERRAAGERIDEERGRRGVERRRGGEPGEAERRAGERAERGGAELPPGDGEEAAEVDEVAVGGRRRRAARPGAVKRLFIGGFVKGVLRKAVSRCNMMPFEP